MSATKAAHVVSHDRKGITFGTYNLAELKTAYLQEVVAPSSIQALTFQGRLRPDQCASQTGRQSCNEDRARAGNL